MADTFVQIDADGVGKKIDTRTDSVGNHRQVTVVGDDGATDEVASVTSANGLDVDVTRLPSGSVSATTATTKDYDTGGGTDTVLVVGIALPASGGSVAGGTATDPIRVDPTGTTTQPVSGTVTANLSATDNAVLDTIDANTDKFTSTASTPAQTTVNASEAEVLAANASRKKLILINAGTTTLYVNMGSGTVTTTNWHIVLSAAASANDGTGGSFIDDGCWVGAIRALSSGAGGKLNITELT